LRKLIAAYGHTIVKGQNGWQPSDLVQEIEPREHPDDRVVRTHIHRPDLDPNSDIAYLGGGKAVVKAVHRLWLEDSTASIAFIGGIPPSMKKKFGNEIIPVSGAKIMSEAIVMCGYLSQAADVIGKTETTEDDTRELLKLAERHDQATVVAMAFRLPRCRLLLKDYVRRNGSDAAAIAERVSFVDAEQFLPEMFDEFVAMNQSKAYALTMAQERFGIQKLLATNP